MDVVSKEKIITEALSKYDYIKLMTADINGVARCRLVTKEAAGEVLRNGMPMWCGMSTLAFNGALVNNELPAMRALSDGNGTFYPSLETLRPAGTKISGSRIGEVYGEIHSDISPVVEGISPRAAARKQLNRLHNLGYQLLSGFELESITMDAKSLKPIHDGGALFISNTGFIQGEDFIIDLLEDCSLCHLKVESFHLEYVPGQYEMVTIPLLGIHSGDNAFALREIIKQVSFRHGLKTTYMSLPFFDGFCGNGLHFNHSLQTIADGKPVFYDNTSDDKLSNVCKYWLAGILEHMNALCALVCPTVNCYQRLRKGFCPVENDWDIDNRGVSTRVKNSSPSSCYIEARLPSSAANPYVVMAAIVAAGLDGLRRKLVCPPAQTATEKLPTTLAEALKALEKDASIVEALGADFIQMFCILKRAEIRCLGGKSALQDSTNARAEMERKFYMGIL